MNIHFIGIGGISMSGLASISLNLGHNVSGSDSLSSATLDKLEAEGIKVLRNQSADNIDDSIDLVVYTAAISNENPELKQARKFESEKKLKTMSRAEFLGELMSMHKNSIAISGTHGKTSTTSMTSSILLNAGMDPTISVGGNLDIINGNYHLGSNNYFLTEACEYVNSFLTLYPKYSIILNIELEHIDFFKNENDLISSFSNFASNTSSDGKIIANGDDLLVRKTLSGFDNVVYFGFDSKNDYVIKNTEIEGKGYIFDLYKKDEFFGHFQTKVLGKFNVLNATSAILVAYLNGVNIDTIAEGLAKYTGVGRRFEEKGEYKGARLFDDYAHHPSEVKNTLDSASKLEKNRLITIFQPHTFSRTKNFLEDFSNSFSSTDILILTDIYPSREKDPGDIHSKDLLNKTIGKVKEIIYISDFDEISNYLKEHIQENDLVLTMGAGNVNTIIDKILEKKG